MRRFLCFLLAVLTGFFITGCHSGENGAVSFYYSRSPELYQYFEEDGVICSEQRDLTGHRDDLRYMIGLYLAGPLTEGLSTPFTKTTRLVSIEMKNNILFVELTEHTNLLSDSEYALACACLTLTCMDFTQCEAVTVTSDGRSVTMNAESILLSDTPSLQETTGG